ncbi:DUF4401 domain-containing protein [Corallococcus macrosporus]|uniref:DUF4401 domain-containing protein n=1 Tax=Myxococcus fulvus (strain ATCC BAA-855 / HW-1) TaxID=483219 RepID=F8CN65_MYXFH|nr:DUF4401 domain-containing protein [Corallococcus macrosporus]AEI69049.1 hypothetical protein LILAB_35840 [Corallococcus macrosporus]
MALRPSLQDVLSTLQAEGQLAPDVLEPARAALEVHQRRSSAMPWFVKAFAGAGAWLAALFVLSFFACAGLWDEQVVMGILGLGLCAGATLLRRALRGVFMEQLALALCLAGATMAVLSFSIETESENVGAALALVISGVLLLVYPDAILRFLSTLGMVGSAGFLAWRLVGGVALDLWLLGCAALMHVLLLEQARLRRGAAGELVGPVAFALACGIPGVLLARGMQDMARHLLEMTSALPDSVLTLGLTALTLYTAWRVLRALSLEPTGVAGAAVFAALTLVAVLTPHTPAVITAVGMLVLGFHRRSSVLLGLAVAYLLASGGWYYYDLGLTLMAKALALMGSGLVFLGLRLFLLRRFPAPATEVR